MYLVQEKVIKYGVADSKITRARNIMNTNISHIVSTARCTSSCTSIQGELSGVVCVPDKFVCPTPPIAFNVLQFKKALTADLRFRESGL
jgi:hypothetical protein